MRVFKEKDYAAMCRRAANLMAAQVTVKPKSVLGLATGSTPLGMYELLGQWCAAGDVDFSNAISINLDEYKGLRPDNDQSYRYFMETNLFKHINIAPENTHVPDGTRDDAKAECARYDALIEELGPIDLQLLGLGHNGHIGFNEPGDVFVRDTHRVDLSQSTIDANQRFFASEADVPRQAYTMGIGAIMRAKHVLLIASGAAKADIIQQAFFGPITPHVPASILQLHRNMTLVGDEEALSKI